MKKPDTRVLEMTPDENKALTANINASELSEDNKKLLTDLIETSAWFTNELKKKEPVSADYEERFISELRKRLLR